VAQALRDPGNLGTMLRTGDAVGAGGLILIDDCADPFSAEAVRASMGAVFTAEGGAGAVGGVPAVAARRCGPAGGRSLRDAVPYRGAPMPRRASSWSATNRAACPRTTRRPATCA
jgi:RNA methyltransferase, TrmH family